VSDSSSLVNNPTRKKAKKVKKRGSYILEKPYKNCLLNTNLPEVFGAEVVEVDAHLNKRNNEAEAQ